MNLIEISVINNMPKHDCCCWISVTGISILMKDLRFDSSVDEDSSLLACYTQSLCK